MEKVKKQKIFRLLNLVALFVIAALLLNYSGQFFAMMHPKGEELVRNTAPEIAEGSWLNSEPFRISELKGKVVVIDFWTFNCINCRHVLPTLNDWFQRYAEKNVVFIGVHTPETAEEENIGSLQKFVRDWKIKFSVVTDNDYRTWNRYKVQFWPSTFLIDKKGTIRELHIGELGYSALEQTLQKLLDE